MKIEINKKQVPKLVRDALDAEDVFSAVINQLEFDKEDELYREEVVGVLKQNLRDFAVARIMESMDEAQVRHLSAYVDEMYTIAPYMEYEDILIEFALIYPTLKRALWEKMPAFFDEFTERFNLVSKG